MSNSQKWIYFFGEPLNGALANPYEILGNKGAFLSQMTEMGLPVPPGFTLSTKACTYFYDNKENLGSTLEAEILAGVEGLKRQGDTDNDVGPLILSVRSGSAASMPGMMDTILNLGLNDQTVEELASHTSDACFALETYHRFIEIYADVVERLDIELFEDIVDAEVKLKKSGTKSNLTSDDWREIVEKSKALFEEESGHAFPQDFNSQLLSAIEAVLRSWMNPRAKVYRKLHHIPDALGTAVTIQKMVFGNKDENSASGVLFSRNPSTGEKCLFGEYLAESQGEDIVAGLRTPLPISNRSGLVLANNDLSLEEFSPENFARLAEISDLLEQHFRDMQDIEFTIEEGKVWILQARPGKRSAKSALKIAVDMVSEGLIEKSEALLRVEPSSLDQLLHPSLDPEGEYSVLTTGLPASPGAVSGEIVFDPDDAQERARKGQDVILVRLETNPEDIHGLYAAKGILTSRGGVTSHAAVVARGMGRPCVTGAGDVRIDFEAETMTVRGTVLSKGDIITLDGSKGHVIKGAVDTAAPELTKECVQLLAWADETRSMEVRANADNPEEAKRALDFGAQGIGLCRTEYMFFETDHIQILQEMILADDSDGRREALDKILPLQREGFEEIFEVMADKPVTIRLLDPPLHEFLPQTKEDIEKSAKAMGVSPALLSQRANDLEEFNPMLGHRGCRLAISFPEIAEMQARAIFEAAINASKTSGSVVTPEIMVPLVASRRELDMIRERIEQIAHEVEKRSGVLVNYQIGTLIELPRAALRAGEIAKSADFFSFGTNDLTQATFGISRDDASAFLSEYAEKGIIDENPFITIDREGVGELIRMGVDRGRNENQTLIVGLSGEHGGDPASVHFCHELGLDYVSCSPFRVPIARLAAAQAALKE